MNSCHPVSVEWFPMQIQENMSFMMLLILKFSNHLEIPFHEFKTSKKKFKISRWFENFKIKSIMKLIFSFLNVNST